jgi:hypothetical protein
MSPRSYFRRSTVVSAGFLCAVLLIMPIVTGCIDDRSGYTVGFNQIRDWLELGPDVFLDEDTLRERVLEKYPPGTIIADVSADLPPGLAVYEGPGLIVDDLQTRIMTVSEKRAAPPCSATSSLTIQFSLTDDGLIGAVIVYYLGACF